MSKLSQSTISIPSSLVSELEAWGRWTTQLFSELRHQSMLDPKPDTDDQAWYWTEPWRSWEQQADRDVEAGRVKTFAGVDDLIADLDI